MGKRSIGFTVIDRLVPGQSDQLLEWCQKQDLFPEHYQNKPTSRACRWWGREIIGYGTPDISWREADPFPKPINYFRNLYYPDANSCLLYRYQRGKGIGLHADKGCEPLVVAINLMVADRNMFGVKELVTDFRWGISYYHLHDGDIAQFNSRVEHGIKSVPCERYSLQFRVVK